MFVYYLSVLHPFTSVTVREEQLSQYSDNERLSPGYILYSAFYCSIANEARKPYQFRVNTTEHVPASRQDAKRKLYQFM